MRRNVVLSAEKIYQVNRHFAISQNSLSVVKGLAESLWKKRSRRRLCRLVILIMARYYNYLQLQQSRIENHLSVDMAVIKLFPTLFPVTF